jgi:hypothetical protein
MMPNKSWKRGRKIVATYDPKCWELACHFLPEDAPETKDLAAHIQDAVEDFLHAAGK